MKNTISIPRNQVQDRQFIVHTDPPIPSTKAQPSAGAPPKTSFNKKANTMESNTEAYILLLVVFAAILLSLYFHF